jgi:hypothetical protein
MRRFTMKILRIALAIIIATGLIFTSSCTRPDTDIPSENGEPPAENTSDFNFVFNYGIMGKNIMDTARGKYTRDMVVDPNITIDLRLTQEEMDRILSKMQEINFFDYPDIFRIQVPQGSSWGIVTPHQTYKFVVTYGAVNKELLWNDEIIYPDEKADKLRELITLIKTIIESKEEYKNLPEPKGGYL